MDRASRGVPQMTVPHVGERGEGRAMPAASSVGLERRGDRPDRGAPSPAGAPPRTARLRRRPTGAAPPLPRHIGWTTRAWGIALLAVVTVVLVAMRSKILREEIDDADAAVLRILAEHRNDGLNSVARAIDAVASGWAMFAVGAALLITLIARRRWQHLFAFLGSVLVVELGGALILDAYHRPRPFDVTIIGDWHGFSLPSATAVIISFTVVGLTFGVVVAGRPRAVAKVFGAVVVGLVVAARLYLGVDHPSDAVIGVVLGTAVPLLAFRFFAPNEAFPVSYRRRKAAHLDVGGRRAEALHSAVGDQLGLRVIDIEPIGLAGSGGSTPLRLRLEDGTHIFGKIYALTHMRADRWYKTFRTILYGRLEDEAPFHSVRRLAQQEDYALRVMRDAGIPTAAPLGVVELTPSREYLVVTEFFEGAVELTEASVDEDVIDQGLRIVRRLWNAGLAHRDIKPANLLLRHGKLLVIDVAFTQIRPSPWREAVDLANMMLVLAVRTNAERVYDRALLQFTPEEIAEAFAAARGVASPSQLRAVMRLDGRDLIGQFRALAPPRRPIPLQRWGVRRIVYAAALVLVAIIATPNVLSMFAPAQLVIDAAPSCGTGDVMVLMAQSVPTASLIPCTAELPAGWDHGGVRVERDRSEFSLHSEAAGQRAVVVTMTPSCATGGWREELSDVPGMRRFVSLPDGRDGPALRSYVGDGMCVRYRYRAGLSRGGEAPAEVEDALSFKPRGHLVTEVALETRQTLCGAVAPSCVGGAP
jgi:membrane-associated phospholipid phosphatase/tRNA A-37 threonylcarbamoyl transferase component Bud32